MATFLKIGSAITDPDARNINGYTPSVGVPGYDFRVRAGETYGHLATNTTITTPWENLVPGPEMDLVINVPKTETKAGHMGVVCPIGTGSMFRATERHPGERTVACVASGLLHSQRKLWRSSGWAIRGEHGVGWVIGTVNAQDFWTQRAVSTGLLPSNDQIPYIIVASYSPVTQAMTIKAATASTVGAEGTDSGVAVSDPSGVWEIGGDPNVTMFEFVSWPRILSPAERDDVLTTLLATYS